MCHIICIKPYHHTVSKFHHFFLSKVFMRIHFFVLISQNRLEESDFYQAQESSPRSHERMNMDLPTTSNISGTHMTNMNDMEVFIFEIYHTHYKYMYTYIITSFWYWWKAFKFKFKIWFIWRSSPQVIELSRLVMGWHGSPGPLAQWAERR